MISESVINVSVIRLQPDSTKEKRVYVNINVLQRVDYIIPFESLENGEFTGMVFTVCHSNKILL